MNDAVSRVLVIRAGQLGDTVCASSIIEPLRHMYGEDVVIDWVAKAGIGKLFAADSRINQVFELASRRSPLLLNKGKREIVAHSYRHAYDLAVNLELGAIFNGVMRLLKASKKIGMPYRHFSEPPESHAVENLHLIYQSFLNADSLCYAQPGLVGTPIDQLQQRYALAEKYLVLVPSNSHHNMAPELNYRNWPVQHWRELIVKLAKKSCQVVVVGGKNETDYFELLTPYPANVLDLVGKTDFPDLVGVLAGADLVITTDTGPAHIAAAVQTPVYTLIGPTNPKRTAPYQTEYNQVKVISANLPCSPCYHTARFKECKQNQCMIDITPGQVLNGLKSR